jgi:PAS domain S-box-containing protein
MVSVSPGFPARAALNSRLAATAVLTAIAYYLGVRIGLALTLPDSPVSLLWPPNALLMAVLILTPARWWWAIVAAALPAHVLAESGAGIPPGMVLSWYVSNSAEAVMGALLIRRATPLPLRLDSFRQAGVFVLFGGVLAPFVTSFLDAGFVWLNQWGNDGYWQVWRMRFSSNVLANLTLVPVVVTVALRGWPRSTPKRYLEASALTLTLVLICWEIFVVRTPSPGVFPAMLYTPLPLLLWAAVRFGAVGVSTALLVFAMLAIGGAMKGQGPFVTSSPEANALSIQAFLSVMAVPLLALAAVMEERRSALLAVQKSEDRLNFAMTAAGLFTWDWDIDGDRIECSDQAGQLFNLPPDDRPTLHDFIALMHPDDQAGVTGLIQEAVERRAGFECEFRVPHGDGSVRWVLCKGRAVSDETGEPVRITGIMVDVTDRKRIELEAATSRRELAHLGRVALVAELWGALAHELHQPLAAILTNAQAGQRFLSHRPPDLEQIGEILDAIADDDRRAGDIIARLRALLRKEAVLQEPLDINDLLRDVVRVARADLIAHEVTVTWNTADCLPFVTGDRVQLQQVILNLVLNACDAMSSTPRRRRRLTLSTDFRPGEGVTIGISDTGTGVPPDGRDRIFEPFVSSKAHGLGLGLAICRSMASAHGGRLWTENNASEGATFFLRLPVRRTEEMPSVVM